MFRKDTWCSGKIAGVQEGYLLFSKDTWSSGRVSEILQGYLLFSKDTWCSESLCADESNHPIRLIGFKKKIDGGYSIII